MNYATRNPQARTNHTTHTGTPAAQACARVALAAAPTIGATWKQPAPSRRAKEDAQTVRVMGYLQTVRDAARFFGL